MHWNSAGSNKSTRFSSSLCLPAWNVFQQENIKHSRLGGQSIPKYEKF